MEWSPDARTNLQNLARKCGRDESGEVKMEENVMDSMETNTAIENDEDRTSVKSTKFPQTRVRNMMKMDPDLHLASQESVFIVCKAAVSL